VSQPARCSVPTLWRPWRLRLFAFECAAGEMPLRPRAVRTFSRGYAPTLAIERHRCSPELARDFCGSNDTPSAAKPVNTIAHFALDFERKERVCGDHGRRAYLALSSCPASADGPPRGLGGGGALLRRHDREECWHVQAQTCADPQGAVYLQATFEGGPQRDRLPSPNASEFETGASACAVARTEWRHNCHRHAFHRLAAAHGALSILVGRQRRDEPGREVRCDRAL